MEDFRRFPWWTWGALWKNNPRGIRMVFFIMRCGLQPARGDDGMTIWSECVEPQDMRLNDGGVQNIALVNIECFREDKSCQLQLGISSHPLDGHVMLGHPFQSELMMNYGELYATQDELSIKVRSDRVGLIVVWKFF